MLEIKNLTVSFSNTEAVKGIDMKAYDGQIVSVVGESGSGKSVTAKSIMGFDFGAKVKGSIRFDDKELMKLSQKEYRAMRGNRLCMIFQEPMTSLNPLHKVGKQILESVKVHRKGTDTKITNEEAKRRVIEVMEEVGLNEGIYDKYPHELSGGMRQRVMIAMAIVNNPGLLIADEPTTALDVATQDQIINLIREVNKTHGTTVLFITHNLKLAKQISDYVYVMEKGRIVESGLAEELFENPKEEYTKKLIDSIPRHIKLKDIMLEK